MKLSHVLIPTLLVATSASFAADLITLPNISVTGNVGMTTNYKFRGEDQTSGNPTTQGSLSFNHKSGAYLTLWGSGVDSSVSAGNTEIDALLGYTTSALGGTVDVGIMRYIYAGSGVPLLEDGTSKEPDFNELYASISYDGALAKGDKIKLGTAFTNEYFAEQGKYYRFSVDYSVPVADRLSLLASAAYNNLDEQEDGSYVDYKAGASFSINGVSAELAYVGGAGDWVDAAKANGYYAFDGKTIFTLSKSF